MLNDYINLIRLFFYPKMLYIVFTLITIIVTLIYYRRPIKKYKPNPTPRNKRHAQTLRCPPHLTHKTIRTIPKGYKINTSYILKKGTVRINNTILNTQNAFLYLCDSYAVTELEICEVEFVNKYYEFMYVSRMVYVYCVFYKQLDKVLIREKFNVLKLSRSELSIAHKCVAEWNEYSAACRSLESVKTKFAKDTEKRYKLCAVDTARVSLKLIRKDENMCTKSEVLCYVFVILAGTLELLFDDEDNNFEIVTGCLFGHYNLYFGLSDYSIKAKSDTLIAYIKIDDIRKCKFKEEDFDFQTLKKFEPIFYRVCAEVEWKQYMPGQVFEGINGGVSVVYQGRVKEEDIEEYEREIANNSNKKSTTHEIGPKNIQNVINEKSTEENNIKQKSSEEINQKNSINTSLDSEFKNCEIEKYSTIKRINVKVNEKINENDQGYGNIELPRSYEKAYKTQPKNFGNELFGPGSVICENYSEERKKNISSVESYNKNSKILYGKYKKSQNVFQCIKDDNTRKYFTCIKKTDIINIPQELNFYGVKTLPSFALSIAKKDFQTRPKKPCKTVLITYSSPKYHFFIETLQNAIVGSVLTLHESDIFFSSVFTKTLDCNRFYNYLGSNEYKYDLILIILKDGFDSIARQVVNYCDTLLMIGKIEPEVPLFCSVEMVNIYQDRVYGNKISNFFNFDKLKMKSFSDLRETLKRKYKDIKVQTKNIKIVGMDLEKTNHGEQEEGVQEKEVLHEIQSKLKKRFATKKQIKNQNNIDHKNQNNHTLYKKEQSNNKKINDKEEKADIFNNSLNISTDDYDKNNAQIFVKYDRIHHISSPKINNFCTKDFERLGRSLLDRRIGVVLSGGGARGLAHIGVIQALEEEGIPIDIIGGTSMGAFVGALYARNCDNISVYKDTKQFASKLSSKWRAFFDLTFPACSMFTGHAFNRILHKIFNNICIEDLWIDYFCISTNVTLFTEMVHRKGLLWRFVRASMSLAGYLPPICEEEKGNINLLLDGGYLNNMPIDVMQNIGADKIIAIDVGSSVINDHYNYGETLNGFYVLFQRFFGGQKFLSMNEVQYRLAYLSDQNRTRNLDENVYIIRPEIENYKTLDFNKYEEIVACGYTTGRKIIKEWKISGVYRKFVVGKRSTKRRFSI